jgi:hypothetical protein
LSPGLPHWAENVFLDIRHEMLQIPVFAQIGTLAGATRARERISVTPAPLAPERKAWMPHPRRSSDMKAASTPYEWADTSFSLIGAGLTVRAWLKSVFISARGQG